MITADPGSEIEIRLSGTVISPGVGFGRAHFEEPIEVDDTAELSEPAEAPVEIARLQTAKDQVRRHFESHLREFHPFGDADLQEIVHAHLAILDDEKFFASIADRIRTERVPAERAIRQSFLEVVDRLAAADDSYLRSRAEDLRDICQSLRKALLHGPDALRGPDRRQEGTVLLSGNLQPSSVLRARRWGAVAYVTSSLALNSHSAMLLRAGAIPAVGAVGWPAERLEQGMPLLVDGLRGEVVLRPLRQTVDQAFARARALESPGEFRAPVPRRARRPDDRLAELRANIDHPSQTALCHRYGLAGIGLFRTEFLALDRRRIPDGEEQFRIYRSVVERLPGRPVVIRTFDLGGDKVVPGLDGCTGANPALGVRGIRRHLLRCPEEFRTQIRAILRAAVGARVSILLPMVTRIGDLRASRAHLKAVMASLEAEGVPFNREVKLGAMIEVPSAALRVTDFLRLADFVSIGTNDLLQYLTATDRENPAVLDYQDPEASGLYELVEHVMEGARRLGREEDVSVCGQLASDPEGARALIELGIRSLSVVPWAAPEVRRALERVGPRSRAAGSCL